MEFTFTPTMQRPHCPTPSELLEWALADGPADIANRANQVQCRAIALQHRCDRILQSYGPEDFDAYCQHRAAHDARRYGLPPMRAPDGWVQFSHHVGRVLSVR
jgi:hypothetical protein